MAIAMGVLALALVGFGRLETPRTDITLTAGEDFTITSQLVSSQPGVTPVTSDRLYPGTQRYLALTVTNPQQVMITVNALGVSSVASSDETHCPAAGVDLSQASFTGSLDVGPNGGTAMEWLPVSLVDTGHGDQDGCEGVTFTFIFTGTAAYTEVYSTSTSVSSSLNPAQVGQSVTYTATVTAVQGTNQDPVPSSPTGVLTFDDGTSVISGCSNLGVTSTSTTTATATCSPPAYLASGAHTIKAIYIDNTGDGNFSGSTSGGITESVDPAPTTITLASSPDPSTFGQAVTLTASVSPTLAPPPPTPAGTVSFYLGTPTGSHSLLGAHALNSSATASLVVSSLPGGSDSVYAVYGGDANYLGSQSTTGSQTVGYTSACIAGAVNGGLTVKAGQSVCLGPGSSVNGGVTVQAGGALYGQGTTVNGGLKVAGATALRVCASTVNGGITVSGSGGVVTLGDGGDDGPPGCAGDSISGGVTLTGNAGGFELAGSNVSGGVTLSGNTVASTSGDGSAEVEGNSISGGLSCAASNNPAVSDDGHPNAVTGARSGQCAAAGF